MSNLPENVVDDVKAVREAKSISEIKKTSEYKVTKEFLVRDAIQKALQSDNSLVQKALKQEQAFRAATENELETTFRSLDQHMAKHGEDAARIQAATLARLETDLALINRLNTALEAYQAKDTDPLEYTAADHYSCTYPAKFNKMDLAISGAKSLITSHFKDIFCEGNLPEGYSFRTNPGDVTMIRNNRYHIYGDSKGTFLKTAILNVGLTCAGAARLQQKLDIDLSAMVHVTALPVNLNLTKLDERFSTFSYLFSDEDASPHHMTQGLVYVHSGYAFGGHRDTASRYALGTKMFGPENCSSWLTKLCGSPTQFSTLDQLYFYRLSVLKKFQQSLGIVPSDYSTTPIVATMTDLFEPIIVKDPQKDIRPGQIYAHRSYDLATDASMQGPGTKGGHTGVLLDFISDREDSSIAIMAYGCNMPEEEGFGVQTFPYASESRSVMLFSVKSQSAASRHAKSDDLRLVSDSAKSIADSTMGAAVGEDTISGAKTNTRADKVPAADKRGCVT